MQFDWDFQSALWQKSIMGLHFMSTASLCKYDTTEQAIATFYIYLYITLQANAAIVHNLTQFQQCSHLSLLVQHVLGLTMHVHTLQNSGGMADAEFWSKTLTIESKVLVVGS